MSKLNASAFRDWNNGEVMGEADYEQAINLLMAAINDNFDRLVKSFKVQNADGSVATTMSLDTAKNFLQFKKGDNIDLVLDTVNGILTIAVKPIGTSIIQNGAVTNDKIALGTITGDRIAPGTITDEQLDPTSDFVTTQAMATQAQASVEWLKINKDFQMRPVTFQDLKDRGITFGMLRNGFVKFYAFKFWRFE
jgi:hypothetical protein